MPYLLSKVDISNAIRYPQFIKDPFFEGYLPQNKITGGLLEFSGGFSMVYCMIKDTEKWALKVWDREIIGNELRLQKISAHLKKSNLPYFVDFKFIKNGLLVTNVKSNESKLVDALRMKWIEGLSLTEYINVNLYNKDVLERLAFDFIKMTKDLRRNRISHGDLKSQNIFITDAGEIKLVDYDSICVPEIDGQKDVCRGTRGFQHPSRITAGTTASLKIDYFSELIIYLSILAIIEDPFLWTRYKVIGNEHRLLFEQEDFSFFESTQIRNDLTSLSPRINNHVKILENYLASHINLVPLTYQKGFFSSYFEWCSMWWKELV